MKIPISSAVAMLLAVSSLSAQQPHSQAQSQKARQTMTQSQRSTPAFEQGTGLNPEKFPAAYNAPARIDVRDCWEIFLTGSFLYWHVGQEGMELAADLQSGATGFVPVPGSYIHKQHQDYRPGFKVGLGGSFDDDNWIGYVEYTWMHQRTHNNLSANRYLLANWYGNDYALNAQAAAIHSSWKLHFDLIDLVVSRPFYQGRKITVAPYGGLRGFSLRQNIRVNATNFTSASTAGLNSNISHNKQKSWAVGLISGMETKWLLGCGFRFEGDAGASLLYNKFTKVSVKQSLNAASVGPVHLREKYNTVRPTLDLAAGLGWGSYINRQNYYIDLAASYEFLYLPGQNMIRYLANQTIGSSSAAPANLYMHGLTAKLRFDF